MSNEASGSRDFDRINRFNFDGRDRSMHYDDSDDYDSDDSDDSNNNNGILLEHGVYQGRWPTREFIPLSRLFTRYPYAEVSSNFTWYRPASPPTQPIRAYHSIVTLNNPALQNVQVSGTRPPPPPPRQLTASEIKAFLENPFDAAETEVDYEARAMQIYNERKAHKEKKIRDKSKYDALSAKLENIELANNVQFDRKLSALQKEDPTYTISRPKFGVSLENDNDYNYNFLLDVLERKLKKLPEPTQTKSGEPKSKRDTIINDKISNAQKYAELRKNQFLIDQKDVMLQMRRRRTSNFTRNITYHA